MAYQNSNIAQNRSHNMSLFPILLCVKNVNTVTLSADISGVGNQQQFNQAKGARQ